ncbi:MAG: molybdopterin-dependent oxidoreductase, partial [Desulfobacterales bacterium]|nr:molybdopterin-dependent oxidoreductase [Desulfobacterales bacterium]
MSKKDVSRLSAEGLVKGTAQFIGDNLNYREVNYLYPVASEKAHARIESIDTKEALAVDGVLRILLAEDIPGINGIGIVRLEEEPLFANDTVSYVGQPIGLVVATTHEAAVLAARKVKVQYTELPPILTIDQALAQDSLFEPPQKIISGDVDTAFKEADIILEGQLESGAQEHLYLETNRTVAQPSDNGGILVYSATQGITEVQEVIAHVLDVPSSTIEMDLMRVGGAFGGKERGGTLWAAMAALAVYHTRIPSILILERTDDMAWTGKRHPFMSVYRAACTKEGRLLALDVELNANGGAFEDLTMPVVERAMIGVVGPYFIPNTRIIGRGCRTHLPPNTAFRGFGAPQASFVIESIVDRIAGKTGRDISDIQRLNFYCEGQATPYGQKVYEAFSPSILDKVLVQSDYHTLCRDVARFNKKHTYTKRGIGLLPMKYGIGFTAIFLNQGNALVWVYMDGSISLSHGGVEMGQGLFTKVAKVVARTLGVSLGRIRCESTNSKRIGSVASTAASSGSDINGYAAHMACLKVKEELAKAASCFLQQKNGLEPWPEGIVFKNDLFWDKRDAAHKERFEDLAHYAYFNRYNLGAQAHYAIPGISWDKEKGRGNPFAYFSIGQCLTVMEVDTLTGTTRIVKGLIVHEGGQTLDEKIDRGQIVGGFMQGYGLVTMEEMKVEPSTGRQEACNLSTYKVPAYSDFPEDFCVDIYSSRNDHASIFGSKGIG